MKKNKLLAEWYGGAALRLLENKAWTPELNAAQVDLLKEKFLKEANIMEIVYSTMQSGFWQVEYSIGHTDKVIEGEGETMMEADLDAILNYLKTKK